MSQESITAASHFQHYDKNILSTYHTTFKAQYRQDIMLTFGTILAILDDTIDNNLLSKFLFLCVCGWNSMIKIFHFQCIWMGISLITTLEYTLTGKLTELIAKPSFFTHNGAESQS